MRADTAGDYIRADPSVTLVCERLGEGWDRDTSAGLPPRQGGWGLTHVLALGWEGVSQGLLRRQTPPESALE